MPPTDMELFDQIGDLIEAFKKEGGTVEDALTALEMQRDILRDESDRNDDDPAAA